MRQRGFEVVSGFDKERITLPQRQTKYSAGYDLAAYGEYIVPSMQVVKINTGLKAYMLPDEFLGIHIRSSLAIKRQIVLVNAQGIIDSDYYNNPDNEGHIIIAVLNMSTQECVIKNGERIAQGIFYKYLTVDNELAVGSRSAGIGSTGK